MQARGGAQQRVRRGGCGSRGRGQALQAGGRGGLAGARGLEGPGGGQGECVAGRSPSQRQGAHPYGRLLASTARSGC